MLAEWCGARNGRRLVSAPPLICPATEATIDTSRSSAGASGGRIDGSRAASMDLPAPGGPTISRLWPPADFERALGAFLTFDVGQIEHRAARLQNFRLRPRQDLRAFEMIGELDQRARGDDFDFRTGPGRFRSASCGAD